MIGADIHVQQLVVQKLQHSILINAVCQVVAHVVDDMGNWHRHIGALSQSQCNCSAESGYSIPIRVGTAPIWQTHLTS